MVDAVKSAAMRQEQDMAKKGTSLRLAIHPSHRAALRKEAGQSPLELWMFGHQVQTRRVFADRSQGRAREL